MQPIRIDVNSLQNPQIRESGIKIQKKEPPSKEAVDTFEKNCFADEVGKEKEWAIFHYVSANNDLEEFLQNDVNNTERIGSNDNMHIVTMFDRDGDNCKVYYIKQDKDKFDSWAPEKQKIQNLDRQLKELKEKRDEIDKGLGKNQPGESKGIDDLLERLSLASKIHSLEKERFETWREYGPRDITSPIVRDMGETDLTDPKVFVDFVADMAKKFPAKRYAILISSHGSGWEGAIDDGFEQMSSPVMGKAFKSIKKELGKKVDLVGFDACQMGAAEIAFELADSAKYMVASQEVLGGTGWAYASFINSAQEAMKAGENLTGESLAKIIVDTADIDKRNIPALSVMNLEKLPAYKKALNKFAQTILDTDTPDSIFRSIADRTQHFDDSHMKDHYHFAQLVSESEEIKDIKVKDSARALMKTIREELVIANRRFDETHANANGVAILIEDVITEDYRDTSDSFSYRDIKLAKTTLWDEAVHKFMKI